MKSQIALVTLGLLFGPSRKGRAKKTARKGNDVPGNKKQGNSRENSQISVETATL